MAYTIPSDVHAVILLTWSLLNLALTKIYFKLRSLKRKHRSRFENISLQIVVWENTKICYDNFADV